MFGEMFLNLFALLGCVILIGIILIVGIAIGNIIMLLIKAGRATSKKINENKKAEKTKEEENDNVSEQR